MRPLILASGSAARARMLRDAGLAINVRPSSLCEAGLKRDLLARGLDACALAGGLAEAKALSAQAAPEEVVLGADQTLDLDGRVLDKPGDLLRLRRQLASLQGRAHRLHSAAALVREGVVLWRGVSSVTLTMRSLSDAELDAYTAMDGAHVLNCVGGYRLEGPGVQLFDAVEGEFFAVLGLPLLAVLKALRMLDRS